MADPVYVDLYYTSKFGHRQVATIRVVAQADADTLSAALAQFPAASAPALSATVQAADSTPAAFAFTDLVDVVAETEQTSAAVVLSGFNSAGVLSVTGGTVSVNGGSFSSDPQAVVSGDSIRARHTSSADPETAVDTVVTVNGVSDTFTSTTAA